MTGRVYFTQIIHGKFTKVIVEAECIRVEVIRTTVVAAGTIEVVVQGIVVVDLNQLFLFASGRRRRWTFRRHRSGSLMMIKAIFTRAQTQQVYFGMNRFRMSRVLKRHAQIRVRESFHQRRTIAQHRIGRYRVRVRVAARM